MPFVERVVPPPYFQHPVSGGALVDRLQIESKKRAVVSAQVDLGQFQPRNKAVVALQT